MIYICVDGFWESLFSDKSPHHLHGHLHVLFFHSTFAGIYPEYITNFTCSTNACLLLLYRILFLSFRALDETFWRKPMFHAQNSIP